MPLEIRKALEDGQNDWFPRLKKIRDSLNHYSIGSCSDFEGRHNGELEPKISYYHDLLGNDMGNELVNNDVFKMLSEFVVKVNMFQGSVYHALNQTLEDKETVQVCGFFNGRIYQRLVSPRQALDINSGRCMSWESFDKGNMPKCPYMDVCKAYENLKV